MMVAVLIAGVCATSVNAARTYEKSDLTALFMSAFMPGAGEWYNSDFNGSFPIAECITGAICPCIGLSSLIDATAGDTSNNKIRIDFWSAPSRD